jgi:hypothetical protein
VGRKSSRYWIFLAVLALHVALLIAVTIRSRYRISVTTRQSVQIVVMLPAKKEEKPVLPPAIPKPAIRTPSLRRPDSGSPGSLPSLLDESPQSNVDWEREARRAAQESVGRAGIPPAKGKTHSPGLAAPNWSLAPKFHKGDQVPTSGGDTMIFINDHCYQIAPAIPTTPSASSNGMGLQTYCIRGSLDPRGDLFKDLAAYKKLHPDR